jgi:uncharacterized membrane protein HdeD (DUF308 family)
MLPPKANHALTTALPNSHKVVDVRSYEMSRFVYNPFADVEAIRGSWGWFLALGISLTLLGVACVAFDVSATFATVFVFGWLLIIGGLVALVHAFRIRTWSGFLFYLLSALFRGFVGYLLLRYPISGAETLTLVLASFFVVSGTFRAIGAASLKFPRWGWSVSAGVISAILGIMLLAQMPLSGVWFIGFAIGVDLIADGIAMIGFANAIHGLPKPSAYVAA